MLRPQITNFLQKLKSQGVWTKNPGGFLRASIQWAESKEIDLTNTAVWWVVNDNPNLFKRNTRKKILLLIARFFANNFTCMSYNSKCCSNTNWSEKIRSRIYSLMPNKWIFLEYYIIDILDRMWSWNDNIKIYKWPIELDCKQIDFFTSRLVSNKKWETISLIYWIQFSISNWRRHWWKERSIYKRTQDINRWISFWDVSPRYSPDLMALLQINANVSIAINDENQKSPFEIAFRQWESEWYKTWWPSKYLTSEIKDDLQILSTTYEPIIKMFENFVQNIPLDKRFNEITKILWWKLEVEYNHETWIVTYGIFRDKDEFVYSLKFFISNEIKRKLLVEK